VLAGDVNAQLASSYSTLLTPVLTADETVLGQPIIYPSSAEALITSAIVSIPPGGQTGWHEHSIPLFAYILEGELTVDYGSEGTRVYRAGEGVMEAIDWPHNGTSTGTVPVRILAVYIGAEAVPTAEAAPAR
jgi:quercetin dioxygenase-like cupin family protein